ncbi:hypothetical protein HBH56_137240 [Parastagonospora nodorum]|nr:hypothetical protein HBH56_137240 [Parastagonospora nodorum]KAH3927953.1 hypothetical protein HBH54_142370 [Parastagonospora nodorum]KAH3948857.1 hypothetical protein HBH53_092340 [Parastagonospora nodorum]KAH4005490.1 hypothetical protein HBI10_034870 [Parastagonospora nodorum]KAH4072631.1 hypothetical protein HBH50_062060 [Parastagonospora nodorum]
MHDVAEEHSSSSSLESESRLLFIAIVLSSAQLPSLARGTSYGSRSTLLTTRLCLRIINLSLHDPLRPTTAPLRPSYRTFIAIFFFALFYINHF